MVTPQAILQTHARPLLTEAGATHGHPLEISITGNQKDFLPLERWEPKFRIRNTTDAESAPVKYSLVITGPDGSEHEVISQDVAAVPVPARHDSGEQGFSLGPIFTFAPHSPPGTYRAVLRAKTLAGEAIGLSVIDAHYAGNAMGSQVEVALIPSKLTYGIGELMTFDLSMVNKSGRDLTVRDTFGIYDPQTGTAIMIRDAEKMATWTLPAGTNTVAPVTFGHTNGWPNWAELPHTWANLDAPGNYMYGWFIYNYSDTVNPIILAQSLVTVSYQSAASISALANLDQVLLHDREQLDIDDLDKIARSANEATALTLGIMTGFADYIRGMELFIKPDEDNQLAVYAKHGYGWQFKGLTIANGQWIRNGEQIQRADLEVWGSFLLLQDQPDAKVDTFARHLPPGSGERWDVVGVRTVTRDEGVVRSSSGDRRLFIDTDPEHVNTDTNRPPRYTDMVPTRRRYVVEFKWFPGGTADQVWAMALPDGWSKKGYVRVRANGAGSHEVYDQPYAPLTVAEHRTYNDSVTGMDHPAGSVRARHLSPELSGGFTEGKDLTMKAQSDEITAARGSCATLNERISVALEDSGTLRPAAIEGPISSALSARIGGIADDRGNLLPGAIAGAAEGMATKSDFMVYMLPNDSTVPALKDYSISDQTAFPSLAHMTFNMGPPGATVSQMDWRCTVDNWVLHCYTECTINTSGDNAMQYRLKIEGMANVAVVANKLLGA